MNDNPLEQTPERQARIRARAHQLWEENGRPAGRDQEFWERAEDLVAMEESAGAGQLPNPQSHPPFHPEGVEEAEVQQNYGEIPGRLTDQGDRPQTPDRRRARRSASRKG